jgi:hypothetical protein
VATWGPGRKTCPVVTRDGTTHPDIRKRMKTKALFFIVIFV